MLLLEQISKVDFKANIYLNIQKVHMQKGVFAYALIATNNRGVVCYSVY